MSSVNVSVNKNAPPKARISFNVLSLIFKKKTERPLNKMGKTKARNTSNDIFIEF